MNITSIRRVIYFNWLLLNNFQMISMSWPGRENMLQLCTWRVSIFHLSFYPPLENEMECWQKRQDCLRRLETKEVWMSAINLWRVWELQYMLLKNWIHKLNYFWISSTLFFFFNLLKWSSNWWQRVKTNAIYLICRDYRHFRVNSS